MLLRGALYSSSLNLREAQSFPSVLSVSIELLLQACDDADADVRLTAGEALNKIIKVPFLICFEYS